MTEAHFLGIIAVFAGAMVRFSGFFVNMPVFGEAIVPSRVKAGLSALCAALLTPYLLRTQDLSAITSLSIPGLALLTVRELVIGITLGFVVLLMIDSLKFAGSVIGMQIGFSFVQVADPQSNRSQGIITEFFQLAGVLIFLILGGHLVLLQAFAHSFVTIPLGGAILGGGIVEEVVLLSRMIFSFGIQVAMPVVAVILVSDVGLGVIARTVPRLNIFQIGFALKTMLGMLVMSLILVHLPALITEFCGKLFGLVATLLRAMAVAG